MTKTATTPVLPHQTPEVQEARRDFQEAEAQLKDALETQQNLWRQREGADRVAAFQAALDLPAVERVVLEAEIKRTRAREHLESAVRQAREALRPYFEEKLRTAHDALNEVLELAVPLNEKVIQVQDEAEAAGLRLSRVHYLNLNAASFSHWVSACRQELRSHSHELTG